MHPGRDAIFGGETVSAENIEEYCSLCGECVIDKGEFVVTGAVGPIKGAVNRDKSIDPSSKQEAKYLQGWVHAVNVTDNQSAVMRLGSLAASVGLKQKGIEPVYQLTCRDRNRIALQSDLLTAYSLGDRQCPTDYRRPHSTWRPQRGKTGLRPGFCAAYRYGHGAAQRPRYYGQ